MKYIVSLKSVKEAPVGFETPEAAVAHFLMTCQNITPEAVIAEMKRRVKHKSKRLKARPVLCVESGVVYPSVNQAMQAYGRNVGHVIDKDKTAYGYHFKYMDE